MKPQSLLLTAVLAACLSSPLLMAATYHIGGNDPGGVNYYATLEDLRRANVLANGDTIILNGNDNTLTASLARNIILQGTGKITPANSAGKFQGNITLDSGSFEFSNFNSTSTGGVFNGNTTISGGTNTFSGNRSSSYGGALSETSGTTTISGGINTFSGNSAGSNGGAINSNNTMISGGINTFSNNNTATSGGAIYSNNLTMTGGTNTFSGNTTTGNNGGAIYLYGASHTLRATDGDFTFLGNRDNVGKVQEKANAIYHNGASTLTLAAREGQNIYFYDPITTSTNTNRTISINPLATDIGRVVFDGSDYTRAVDRHSAVYGNTTVGYGELALQGGAIYGVANNIGTFTLNKDATLSSSNGTNKIQANRITMNGMVDVANGGTLELATALGVNFNGTLNVGLGLDAFGETTSGFLSTIGNLTFGTNALLSVYGDDSLFTANSWSHEYNLFDMFSATNISGLANLMFDASWFDAYDGFCYTLDRGILTLSYTAAEVPEPGTLVILGLGLAGLPLVRRFRRG